MPGLRSLVARRRSSLASTPPPCSPHSRTNTPSPSFSSSTDNAPPVSSPLGRYLADEKNHCLMPGSGDESAGGEEGVQEEKEAAGPEKETAGQQEQGSVNRNTNVSQEADVIISHEEEARSSKDIEEKNKNELLENTVQSASENVTDEGSKILSNEITRSNTPQGVSETEKQKLDAGEYPSHSGDKRTCETDQNTFPSNVSDGNTQQGVCEAVDLNDSILKIQESNPDGGDNEGISASNSADRGVPEKDNSQQCPSINPGGGEGSESLCITNRDSLSESGEEESHNKSLDSKEGIEESEVVNIHQYEIYKNSNNEQLQSVIESEERKDESRKPEEESNESKDNEKSEDLNVTNVKDNAAKKEGKTDGETEDGDVCDKVMNDEVRRDTVENETSVPGNQYQDITKTEVECSSDDMNDNVSEEEPEERKECEERKENMEKDAGVVNKEIVEQLMDCENWDEAEDRIISGEGEEDNVAQEAGNYDDESESVGYPSLEDIEAYELGGENEEDEYREDGRNYDEFMEFEDEDNIGEYQEGMVTYKGESIKSGGEEKKFSPDCEATVSKVITEELGNEFDDREKNIGMVREWTENFPGGEESHEEHVQSTMTELGQSSKFSGAEEEYASTSKIGQAYDEYRTPLTQDLEEETREAEIDFGKRDDSVGELCEPSTDLELNTDNLGQVKERDAGYTEQALEGSYSECRQSHTDDNVRIKNEDEEFSRDSTQETEESAGYPGTELSSEDVRQCLKEEREGEDQGNKFTDEDNSVAREYKPELLIGGSSVEGEKHSIELSKKSKMAEGEGDKSSDSADSDIKVVGDGSQASGLINKESLKEDAPVNKKRPYPFTVSPKVKKGPGRCSDLTATEIESTLASRGVTIVRRMVDSKDNNTGRGNNESSENTKKEGSQKSGVVVTPHVRNTRQSARLQSLYKNQGRPNLREYGPGLDMSHCSRTQVTGSSGITKELYRSINARGTLIHPGSKAPQTGSNIKGAIQFNTRGVSIQFNPKGTASSLRGSGMLSKTRGPNIFTNTKGGNMQVNARGITMQGVPRIFNSTTRSRGAIHHSLRGSNLQSNPRALAVLANQRGLTRPMRYSSPRGTLRGGLHGNASVPRSAAGTLNPRMRGLGPQAFKSGTNQLQSNTSGLALQPKSSMGLSLSKSGAVPLHSTPPIISQGRGMKISPHSQATINTPFKIGDMVSQPRTNTGNMPLQSNLAGMSPQRQASERMLSPHNRPAEMSPHSRPTRISPQSVDSGIYAQSKYTDRTSQSGVGMTGQGMMMNQSKSGIPRSPAGSTTPQPRPGLSAGHIPIPSSSQHLAHMGMMDYPTHSGTGIGLPSHSSASSRLLPPHSVAGGLMPQGSSSLTSQLLSSGLPPLATSDNFTASTASEGFPVLSHTEFLSRPSETFSPYSALSDFPPHSSAATDFPANLNTGDFNMQSTAGGFPTQTSLVGFPPQSIPCGYPQHPSSGGFPSHNSGSVIGHTATDSFASHQGFTPTPVNTTIYPPHSTAQLYNTPTNPTDILGYPGSRDFLMNPSSREFPTYSGSHQLANQIPQEMSTPSTHRDIQLSQHPRDFSLQSSTTGMPSGAGNSSLSTIVGEQYSQQTYGDPLAHSSYQPDPLHSRSNPSEVPLLPDLRDSSLRQNFRESSVPMYSNFRDPVEQGNLRSSQMQGSYRDMPLNPNMPPVQPHPGNRTPNLQTGFKDQSLPSAYRDQDIISNYLDSSVLNYREAGEMGTCQDQTSPAYRPASSHTSPSEQVLPSYSNPASHPSPQEHQVLSNFSEGASPRDQVLPPQPCQDGGGQISVGESVLPGFRDTINNSTSAHQDLSGFRDSMTYTGYRDSGSYGIGCEKPGSNTSDYASSSSRHSDVTQSERSSTYKDPHTVPGYRISDPQSNIKYKEDLGTCGDGTLLPSFTESFDSTSPNDINRKDSNSTLSHYKPMSEYGSLKGSPASVSTEGTSATSPFVNHHTGEMSPLANPHSYALEHNTYQNKRMYGGQPHDSYSQAQFHDDGGGGHLPKGPPNNYTSPGDNFFPETSGIHTTLTTSTHGGPKNSIAKSDMTGSLSQPIVSDSQLPSGESIVQGPSSTRNVMSIPGNRILSDMRSRDVESNYLYQGDKGLSGNTQEQSLGFRKDTKEVSGAQMSGQVALNANDLSDRMTYQPFLGSDSLSPGCPITAASKFPSVSSPSKSDSNPSPSTQERIVIKMKLLHANSTVEDNGELVEKASVNDTGINKNSVKYSMAKYTRWTIDSIINGSEEGSDGASREEDCRTLQLEKDDNLDRTTAVRKTSKQRTSESCNDVKDASLDTNKNFMKKSLKITITNSVHAHTSSDDDSDAEKAKKKCSTEDAVLVKEHVNVNDEIQFLEAPVDGSKKEDTAGITCNIHSSRRNTRNSKRTRSPSPSPSLESCNSTSSLSRGSFESSTSSIHSVVKESPESGDLKKCSIVIKRIYTDNNHSCYSSSLCDDNGNQNIDDEGNRRRPKRKAAMEASERCHKFLRPLDTNSTKVGKMPVQLEKDNEVTLNPANNKMMAENIPRCSVILYDVFMDSRLNKFSCPGCSRHYDSTDSIQVNISKATISLLCSKCQWLVVKDVRPHEISSLAPS
ncbi:hypothetical protein Pmani_023591 [Petrolisthes manimaculis]|uniref:Uncharacterized protein n=1 Tax=Petrolisthes manimaculis TaxID=1843537 RepID=A0AAE1P9R2_9EUCA|nr:hypothetical protein Pmani_023591 [Petrolisthes manimaculis]